MLAWAFLVVAIPVVTMVALIALAVDGIGKLVDRRRQARWREQQRLLQIRAKEARARYQLDQITVAATQAILNAANHQSD